MADPHTKSKGSSNFASFCGNCMGFTQGICEYLSGSNFYLNNLDLLCCCQGVPSFTFVSLPSKVVGRAEVSPKKHRKIPSTRMPAECFQCFTTWRTPMAPPRDSSEWGSRIWTHGLKWLIFSREQNQWLNHQYPSVGVEGDLLWFFKKPPGKTRVFLDLANQVAGSGRLCGVRSEAWNMCDASNPDS